MDMNHFPLLQYLREKNEKYYAKALELRDAVQGWLAYIPQSFPHYTRHTVLHSDAIVIQLSKLLFKNGDPTRPSVNLSGAEAYVLVASAYLHDAGMVCSDKEKSQLLSTDDWKDWTTGAGGGSKRFEAIKAFRESGTPTDSVLRHFLADVQTRFLIAEFIRARHHHRSGDVISQHRVALANFSFGDPLLERTITDVCVGHGLRRELLEDNERYPEMRDIGGDIVNVRFLAILFRLGDLLDLSYDRACPLLLNAASPLPAESLAHWTQYQHITHRLTSPERIEITAECRSQEEHRVLQDWCQWIVDEARNSAVVAAHAKRHSEWKPPLASFDEKDQSISIRPAKDARYVFSRWKMQLDPTEIFNRLIFDVYDEPDAYIRELIQNALDATRCQMYLDLAKDRLEIPNYPTRVEKERRDRYQIRVELTTRVVKNELSHEDETHQVVAIDDMGVGMDRNIIENYFLQIGRSYYQSPDFQKSFTFAPTSRFGVGFLSVFSVSNHVVVDTFKPSSNQNDGPLRLTLTAPRSYLLTEKSDRDNSGTRVEVQLRDKLTEGQLTRIVSELCRRVEFPIIVVEQGKSILLESEKADQFLHEAPDISEDEAKFVIRAFPITRRGYEGELYVFAHVGKNGESWTKWSWARYEYLGKSPLALIPELPGNLMCLHGLAIDRMIFRQSGQISIRVDFRGPNVEFTMSRSKISSDHKLLSTISSDLESILTDHLNTTLYAVGENAWEYKQQLIDVFPLPDFWEKVEGCMKCNISGATRLYSLQSVQRLPTIATIISPITQYEYMTDRKPKRATKPMPPWEHELPALLDEDIDKLSHSHRQAIFADRRIDNVCELPDGHLAIEWRQGRNQSAEFAKAFRGARYMLVTLPKKEVIGILLHKTTHVVYGQPVLNRQNAFVQWLVRAQSACLKGVYGLRMDQFERLISLIHIPIHHGGHQVDKLENFLAGWRRIPGLPPELAPPTVRKDEFQYFKGL